MIRSRVPPQIAKLLPLLASDRDGEVVAAARAVGRALTAVGLDFHDLARAIAPDSEPCRRSFRWSAAQAPRQHVSDADAIAWCLHRADDWLSPKDLAFLRSAGPRLRRCGGRLSVPQRAWLDDIRQRINGREAA